jgi:hypothetical protein
LAVALVGSRAPPPPREASSELTPLPVIEEADEEERGGPPPPPVSSVDVTESVVVFGSRDALAFRPSSFSVRQKGNTGTQAHRHTGTHSRHGEIATVRTPSLPNVPAGFASVVPVSRDDASKDGDGRSSGFSSLLLDSRPFALCHDTRWGEHRANRPHTRTRKETATDRVRKPCRPWLARTVRLSACDLPGSSNVERTERPASRQETGLWQTGRLL